MIIQALIAIFVIVAFGNWYKKRTGHLPEWKYFKPYSVTWWVTLLPGVAGILISGEPLHGWGDLAEALNNTTGHADPSTLIYSSALGVGLVGRVSK